LSRAKQSFIAGTMILLSAGIINRIFGFIPRIALPRIIGAEGVGLFQLGYPFLSAVLTLITGGIPLAVAKLVAEAESERNERRVRSILVISLAITASLAIVFTAACIIAAPWITTHLWTDSRVYPTFLCMTAIIPLAGISSVLRGYFQGRQNMIPSAASSVTETAIRVVMVIAFARLLVPYGIEYAAAGAMFGVVAGELGGFLVLLLHYLRTKRGYLSYISAKIGSNPLKTSGLANLRRIMTISIPVTGSRLVGSFSSLLESILIMQSLAVAGIATAAATAQYGMLTGMIMPVVYLPSALTFSLAVSLVPSLSEAAARKDMPTIHKRLHQSLRLALVAGAPFAVFMIVLSDPLCHFLYGQSQAGGMLRMVAPIALFIYFQAPLSAALQALGRPGTALVNALIGAAVKLVCIVWLASKPEWGIRGAIVAINVNYVLVTLLNWRSIAKMLKFSLPGGDFLKVGLSMLLMAAACYVPTNVSPVSPSFVSFAASLAAGAAVYLLCIFRFQLVDKYDIRRIPWIGKKLVR